MKRTIAIFLSILILITAFAGCKSTETKKIEDTKLIDIYNETKDLTKGSEYSIGVILNVSGVEENNTDGGEEAYESGPDLFALLKDYKKDDGSYSIPVSVSGQIADNAVTANVKIGTSDVIDTTVISDKIYVNAKKAFDLFKKILSETGMPTEFFTWPNETEYIELTNFIKNAQQAMFGLSGMGNEDDADIGFDFDYYEEEGENNENYGDLEEHESGLAITDLFVNFDILLKLVENIPEKIITDVITLVQSAFDKAKAFSVDDGYLTLKVNNDNVKTISDNLATEIESKLPAILDAFKTYAAESTVMTQEMKEQIADMDVTATVSDIADTFKDIDDVDMDEQAEIKIGYKTDKDGVDFVVSIDVDGDEYSGFDTLSLKCELALKEKDIDAIVAPEVLTDKETTDLITMLFSAFFIAN